MHGGAGTRLRPLTHTGPKQLIPVANKPISQYVLEDILECGIDDVAIVLGNTYPEKVKEHFGDGSGFKARVHYVDQGEPKGIAHAVGLCEGFIQNDSFVVYLGDNLIRDGIKKFAEVFEESEFDALILLCKVREPERFGVAEFNSDGKLKRLIEKPKVPPSDYALTGIYFFKPIVFEMIKHLELSWRGELEITDAIQLLLSRGYKVGHEIVTGWWKDTGTPSDILEANRLVLDELQTDVAGEIEDEDSIQGRVALEDSSIIEKGSIVRGPVAIGKRSRIRQGVYVGPYSSIGNDVTIKRGEVENSIIMDNCFIDINDRIVDSIVASYTRIVSSINSKPTGKKLVLGERCYLEL